MADRCARTNFRPVRAGPGQHVVTDAVYRKAVEDYLPRLRGVLRETFARTKTVALVFPATMTTAPRIGDEGTLLIGGRKVSFEDAMSRNSAPGSTAGVPGLVIPAGRCPRIRRFRGIGPGAARSRRCG